MADHVITLAKPDQKNGYPTGRRAILVDGIAWGHTWVTHHGMHGTSYTFHQINGEMLHMKPGPDASEWEQKHPREHKVRSMNKRRARINSAPWRPTEELIIEKATALVAAGELRHPDVVKVEVDERRRRFVAEREAEEQQELESLKTRARDIVEQMQRGACGEHLINEIVAAMKWAQTQ